MKKTLLILIMIFSYAKGYSQLMQSNTVWPSAKKTNAETIPHLKQVSNRSDSLISNTPVKIETSMLEAITGRKKLNEKITAIESSIEKLTDSLQTEKSAKEQARLNEEIKRLETVNEQNNRKLEAAKLTIENSAAEKLKLYDQINNLKIEKYNEYLQTLDKELAQYDQEIDKNTKRAISSFDTVIRSSDIKTQHLIDSISNYMNLNCYIIKQKFNALKPGRDTINKYLEDLKKLQQDIRTYKSIKETIYIMAIATITKLDSVSALFVKGKLSFINEYNTYREKVNKDIDRLNDIGEKIKKANAAEATEDEKLAALGGINKILGDEGALSPNISIIGQKKFKGDEKSSFYGEAKLFIGGNEDDKKVTGVNRLFIPDASTYGFMTDFTFGFISSYKTPKLNNETGHYEYSLAINLGVYYLGKKLQPDTLTSFNTSLFHVKLGLQYILFPQALSVYVNTNQVLVATRISNFEKYYPNATRVRSFTSFGVESYLDLKSDFHLLVNMGFVLINRDVNTWMNTSDSIIPNIKLSLVKTFNW